MQIAQFHGHTALGAHPLDLTWPWIGLCGVTCWYVCGGAGRACLCEGRWCVLGLCVFVAYLMFACTLCEVWVCDRLNV